MNDDARPEETKSETPDGTSTSKPQYSEGADGVVQLRFTDLADNVTDINAAELAEAIQGLVEYTSEMARSGLFGAEAPPELRVRPPKEGSFIVEAVLHLYNDAPDAVVGTGVAAVAGLAQSIRVGIRRLRGEEPTDVEYLDTGDVKVSWPSGTFDEVPAEVWRNLSQDRRRTRRALRKLLAPLSDDVDTLEIRDGSAQASTAEILATPVEVVAERTDYRIAQHEEDEIEELESEFEAEAILRSIDFRDGAKWTVQTLVDGTRKATVEDEDFLRRLDEGMAIHKNDIFDVKIREVATVKNGRTVRDWSLIRVVRKRRGDDDDSSASSRGPA